jgi:acyl-CoA thioesterase I
MKLFSSIALYRVCHSLVQGFVLILAFFLVFPVSAQQTSQKTILVMGDSLSAGYGLASNQGWVSLTAVRIKAEHPDWKVVNASISGETTHGGISRLPAALKRHKPHLVIIELGANDGLRGLPLPQTRANLLKMIQLSKNNKAQILLIGMQMPPNLGQAYTRNFVEVYQQLATQEKIKLLPFLLQPIAADRHYFQADQMHPTAAGQVKISAHVWPALKPLLQSP